jgi:Rrf2 family protein
MATNVQFSIAVHLMVELCCQPERSATSAHLAKSVNTNASFVRRILAKLAKANLIRIMTGKSGAACVDKDPETVSLLEIYQAMEHPKPISIHQYAQQESFIVSCRIEETLEKALAKPQDAMEASLASISLRQIVKDVTASQVAIVVIHPSRQHRRRV